MTKSKFLKILPVVLIAAGLPAGAIAAPAASDTPKGAAKPTISKPQPDFDAMFAFIDKLFPPQAAPDPARLALARVSVHSMWPDGAYGKMMSSFMGGIFDRAMQLKPSDLAALGKPGEAAAAGGKMDVSLHDKAASEDPYFDQRIAAMRQVLESEVGKISAVVDPRMRDGLSRAMARRFDTRQLTDINAFMATPSGQAFAGQYMQLWMDPDTIRSIFASAPEMMKMMPDIMQKVKAANDKFPKPEKKDTKAEAKPAPKSGKH